MSEEFSLEDVFVTVLAEELSDLTFGNDDELRLIEREFIDFCAGFPESIDDLPCEEEGVEGHVNDDNVVETTSIPMSTIICKSRLKQCT